MLILPFALILITTSNCHRRALVAQNKNSYLCAFCAFCVLLRAEAAAIFGGEEEAEDHVAEVARIVGKCCDPVVVTNRIGIAPEISEVLHRHKRADEKLIFNSFALDDLTQYLPARLLICLK